MYGNMPHSYMSIGSKNTNFQGAPQPSYQYFTEISPLETTLRNATQYDTQDAEKSTYGKSSFEPGDDDKGSYTPLGIDSMLEHQEKYDAIDANISQRRSEKSDSAIAEVSEDMIRSRLYGLGSEYLMMNGQQEIYIKNEEEKRIHIEIPKKPDDNSSMKHSKESMMTQVKEIFTAVTGEEMPEDIEINVLDKETFFKTSAKIRGAIDGILGFAQHSPDIYTPRQIFVKTSTVAQVLAVIGHEIGHVVSERKGNAHDEEAKAIAFEYAWTRTIQEFDMAGVGHQIRSFPLARNGLHDIAQMFVENKMKEGIDPLDIFDDIVADRISVAQMASHVLPES